MSVDFDCHKQSNPPLDEPHPYRVVDIVAGRYTISNPTRALHLNCGFPVGDPTFCVGIHVKP